MISSVFFHAFHVIVQKFPHAGTGIPICFLANSFMDHHGILCHASLHERRPALSSISKQTGQMAWRSGRPSFSPGHGAVFLFMECSAEYVKARPRHRSSFRHSCQGKFFPGTLPHGSGTLLPGQHPAFPETLCGNRHQCRTPRLLQPCPARGGNTDGLSIGLSPSLAVFNFRTKYGFSMQTSRKPDASDRAIYQWLKNRMKMEKREK